MLTCMHVVMFRSYACCMHAYCNVHMDVDMHIVCAYAHTICCNVQIICMLHAYCNVHMHVVYNVQIICMLHACIL